MPTDPARPTAASPTRPVIPEGSRRKVSGTDAIGTRSAELVNEEDSKTNAEASGESPAVAASTSEEEQFARSPTMGFSVDQSAPNPVLKSVETPKEDAANEDPLVGMIVGERYRLLERVGMGGMGAVYRGEHTSLRKRVAVKFLHGELSRVPDIIARFEREAIAAANLEHPNVVAAHDFGKTPDGQFFLVMEYVDGPDLGSVIDKNGALPPERAVPIARHIAAALTRAHSLGIVHRDLKPENVVLVERDGDPDFAKVIDFGIAKAPPGKLSGTGGAITRAGMVVGTPEYMAPEQALGREVDYRADLYAFGVMVFEMLTGQRPFEDEDVMSLLSKHMTAPPPALSSFFEPGVMPPEADAVLTKMLAKSPKDRFTSAMEFVQALEAAFGIAPNVLSLSSPMLPAVTDPALLGAGASPSQRKTVGPRRPAQVAPEPVKEETTSPRLQAVTAPETVSTPEGERASSTGSVAPVVTPRTTTLTSESLGKALHTVQTHVSELRSKPEGRRLLAIGGAVSVLLLILGVSSFRKPPTVNVTPGNTTPTTQPRVEPLTTRPTTPSNPTLSVVPPPTAPTPSATLEARVAAWRARPEVSTHLDEARGHRLPTVIRVVQQLQAAAPEDPIAAYVLGSLYARDPRMRPQAIERYQFALQHEPDFAHDPTLVRDVLKAATEGRTPTPGAEELLRTRLASSAGPMLLSVALEGQGAARTRAERLLRSTEFASVYNDTARDLMGLVRARSCEQKLPFVQRLADHGDARALPYLRGIRTGRGCGFLGLGVCNPCLQNVLPSAIRSIERRAER